MEKKVLKLFIFMIGVFLVFCSNALADQVVVDYPVGGIRPSVTRDDRTTVLKVTTDNKLLYCANPNKYDPGPTSGGYTYWNCDSKLNTNKKQLLYVLANGFKGTNISDKEKEDSFFTTQMAIWHFIEPENIDEEIESSSLKSTIQSKIDAADNYAKTEPKILISLNGGNTLSLTNDGKYYISNPITIDGIGLSTDITVSVSGANGVFVTSNIGATSGATSFKSGSKVYIKVPESSITKSSNVTFSAKGEYVNYTGTIDICTPENPTANIQSVIRHNPGQENKAVSNSISLNITLKDVVISKQDITGSKEIEGAKLVVKRNNDVVDPWTSTSTPRTLSLAAGTYTLEETVAPDGYIKSTSKITFVVKDDGKVTIDGKEVKSVVMKNEPILVYISKKSINGKTELPGAKLKITDKEGKVVKDLDGKELEWTSSTKEESFHLAAGTYYLTETIAPEGYELSETVLEFTVTSDGKVKMDKKDVDNNLIVYTNTPEAEEVKTGSFLIYIIVIGTIATGLITYFVMKKGHA